MITRFLGAPIEQAPNPHCAYAKPMRLYAAAATQQIERSDAFRQYLGDRAQSRLAAKQRAAAKRRQLLEEIARVPIRVHPIPARALTGAALQHYVALQAEPYEDPQGLIEALPTDGITPWLECTFLRHTRVDVSDLLEAAYRRTGRAWAEVIATTRLFAAIAEHWPHLATEAERQWRRWWGQYRSRAGLGAAPDAVDDALAALEDLA